LSTCTLSIRIRKDLKKRMEMIKDIDWRSEIEAFIERRIKEIELKKVLDQINQTLKDVSPSTEPAWKTIREFREGR